MRKRKLGLLVLMLLLVLSTALAACASDAGDGKKEDGKKEGTKTEDGKNVKDTLVFGRGGDSTSLDPSRVTEGESFKVTVNIYETLLNFGEQDTDD